MQNQIRFGFSFFLSSVITDTMPGILDILKQ